MICSLACRALFQHHMFRSLAYNVLFHHVTICSFARDHPFGSDILPTQIWCSQRLASGICTTNNTKQRTPRHTMKWVMRLWMKMRRLLIIQFLSFLIGSFTCEVLFHHAIVRSLKYDDPFLSMSLSVPLHVISCSIISLSVPLPRSGWVWWCFCCWSWLIWWRWSCAGGKFGGDSGFKSGSWDVTLSGRTETWMSQLGQII